MSKTKTAHGKKINPKHRSQDKTAPETTAALENPDCPYRFPGSLYGTLFIEANKNYLPKAELIKRVAEMTGKSEKVVNFAYQVLKSPSHRSNKNRSRELTEGERVKLVAIRKPY